MIRGGQVGRWTVDSYGLQRATPVELNKIHKTASEVEGAKYSFRSRTKNGIGHVDLAEEVVYVNPILKLRVRELTVEQPVLYELKLNKVVRRCTSRFEIVTRMMIKICFVFCPFLAEGKQWLWFATNVLASSIGYCILYSNYWLLLHPLSWKL